LLKFIGLTLAIIVMALGLYEFITNNFAINPYLMFFFGVMSVVNGISELLKKRYQSGVLFILASLLILLGFIFYFANVRF
jgi:hypothetical protein